MMIFPTNRLLWITLLVAVAVASGRRPARPPNVRTHSRPQPRRNGLTGRTRLIPDRLQQQLQVAATKPTRDRTSYPGRSKHRGWKSRCQSSDKNSGGRVVSEYQKRERVIRNEIEDTKGNCLLPVVAEGQYEELAKHVYVRGNDCQIQIRASELSEDMFETLSPNDMFEDISTDEMTHFRVTNQKNPRLQHRENILEVRVEFSQGVYNTDDFYFYGYIVQDGKPTWEWCRFPVNAYLDTLCLLCQGLRTKPTGKPCLQCFGAGTMCSITTKAEETYKAEQSFLFLESRLAEQRKEEEQRRKTLVENEDNRSETNSLPSIPPTESSETSETHDSEVLSEASIETHDSIMVLEPDSNCNRVTQRTQIRKRRGSESRSASLLSDSTLDIGDIGRKADRPSASSPAAGSDDVEIPSTYEPSGTRFSKTEMTYADTDEVLHVEPASRTPQEVRPNVIESQ